MQTSLSKSEATPADKINFNYKHFRYYYMISFKNVKI